MPIRTKNLPRRIVLGLGIALATLLVLLLLAGGAIAFWLSRADLRPVVERAASESLQRSVTLGSIEVQWGNPLGIEIADLAIANVPWGSEPDMVRVGRVSALVDLGALLTGVLHYQRLRIADATVVLERDAEGSGNWKFGGATGDFPLIPRNRTEFPTLIDFVGDRGLITYRTRGGDQLQIRLDRLAIASSGDHEPARVLAHGAYNDVPTWLDASTDSYATLRDTGEPFGMRFTLRGHETDIGFNGRLWQPLDFDGVRGELSIQARTLQEILRIVGGDAAADMPLSLAGVLRRDGNAWSLAAAKGQAKQSGFSGSLALHEGGPGKPDELDLDLDFGTLDLDEIAASFGGTEGPVALQAIPLQPHRMAGLNTTTELTALRARVGGRDWHAVALQGRLAGGEATVEELSFTLGGGTLSMAGALGGKGGDGQLDLQARLSRASVSQLARALGATAGEIQGRVEGAATLSMTGPTIGTALKRSQGAAVLTVREGEIARDLIERLSTDLRSLFRSKEGSVPVSCLIGVLTIRNGLGVLSPLRLESREAIATGAGKIDLVRDKLDLTVRTERDSTNFFALDIPVRISGPLGDLTAKPLVGSKEDWLKQPAAAAERLPPELHDLADESRCRT